MSTHTTTISDRILAILIGLAAFAAIWGVSEIIGLIAQATAVEGRS